MSILLDYSPRRHSRQRFALAVLSWSALFLAFVYFLFRGPIFPNGQRLWDYAVCASSSYLWVHGEDPFAWEAVKASWLERGSAPGIEDNIGWLYAIVPPTTLAVLAPFAALPVAIGAYLYLALTTILLGVSAWVCGCWANLDGENAWRYYVAAILVSVPATLGLYSGNPTMLAAPLLLTGSFLVAKRRSVGLELLGGVLIGVGLACKLQIGVPVLALWVVWGRWRGSFVAVLIAILIGTVAVGRLEAAGVEWLTQWVENVRKTNSAGGLNDYVSAKNPDDLVNLQVPLYRLIGERTETDRLTLAIWVILSVGVLVGILRARRSDAFELMAMSMVGLLTLLPVYHRTYDAIILLPLVAMLFAGLSRDRRWWTGWISLALMASLLVPAGLPYFLTRRQYLGSLENSILLSTVVIGHKGWCILALSVLLTGHLLLKTHRTEMVQVQEKS